MVNKQGGICDAAFSRDPSAMARVQGSVWVREAKMKTLFFALQSFRPDELGRMLAEAMIAATGSKGKAFNVLDAATKEVEK